MNNQQGVKASEFWHRGAQVCLSYMRELSYTGGHKETFETDHAGVVQRGQFTCVPWHNTTPESAVDVAIDMCRFQLRCESLQRSRRRDGIERHINERGYATRSSRERCCSESFPVSAPGLIDMNMGIYQAGHNNRLVVRVDHLAAGWLFIIGT